MDENLFPILSENFFDTGLKKNAEIYGRFLRSLKPYLKTLILLFVLFTCVIIIELGFPFFIHGRFQALVGRESFFRFKISLLIAVGLISLRLILGVAEQYQVFRFSYSYTNQLKKVIFSRFVSLKISTFENLSPGTMLARMTYNIGLLRLGIEQCAFQFIKQMILLLGLWFYSYYLGVTFIIVTALVCILMFFSMLIVQRIIRRYVAILQTKNAQITEELYDLFRNWSTIKLFRLEEESFRSFSKIVDEDQYFRVRRILIYSFLNSAIYAVAGFLVVGFLAFVFGKKEIGPYLLYAFYIGFLSRVFAQTLKAGALFQALKVGVITVFRFAPSLEIILPTFGKKQINRGHLEFKNVTFKYPTNTFRLDHVTCSFDPGSKNLILGPGASGKSALLQLAKGLQSGLGGSVEIDGCDIQSCSQKSLREDIAYLSAEANFLEGSFSSNILLSKDRVISASDDLTELANLFYEFDMKNLMMKHRNKLGTQLSSQRTLSSTETKVFSAMRAFRYKPKIILMDQFFSGLDEPFVKKILDYMSQHLPKSTLVYADCSTNNHFHYDKIFEIKNRTLVSKE